MYTGNELCDFCIDIMEWWGNNTPLSYGAINVLLFVVVQPLLIILFFTTTLIAVWSKSLKVRKWIAVFSILLMLLLVIGVFLLFALPVVDVGTDMRMGV